MQANKWEEIAPMAERRCMAAAAVLNGKIYVVGGMNAKMVTSTERYDPQQNTWASVASLNVARNGHCCCVINGSLFAVCGHFISIERYD